MDYVDSKFKAGQEPKNNTTSEEEVDYGSWNMSCVKIVKEEHDDNSLWSLYQRSQAYSQQDLHEKVVIGGVFISFYSCLFLI